MGAAGPSSRPRRARPGGDRRALLELAALVLMVALYWWLHNLAGTDAARATSNAHALQSLEHSLGLDIELSANQWLAQHPVVGVLTVWYYRLYYLPLAAVLLWVLFWHAETYRRVRVTLIVMAGVALLAFWLLPMAPPRFALPGVVDIVAEHDVIAGAASRDLTNGQNHFSAFPSLHVGWSALCAYAAWLALRRRYPRLSLLVWLFPSIMVAVVITTGNHYVLDVVGSAVLLAIAVAAAHGWESYRRHRAQLGERPTRE